MDQIDKKITDDLWALSAIGVRSLQYFLMTLINVTKKLSDIYMKYLLFLDYRNGTPNKFKEFALG